ncbi:MAG: carboxymuconolactone decarboxylase family protein [Pseudobdellovibrionaceae bacterium]
MRVSAKSISEYPFIARLIFWAQKRKYGETLAPSKLWALSPKILYGLQVLYRAIDRKASPVEPQLRSLIGVRISQINHCEFCTDIGSSLLQKRNVSMEKIKSLAQYAESSLFTDKEKAALTYAEAMTYSDRGVTDEIFDRLRKFFDDKEIVELTALIAYQNLSSKFNAALRVPPQGFCFVPTKGKGESSLNV